MHIVAFDFVQKRERTLGAGERLSAADNNAFLWLTATPEETAGLPARFAELGISSPACARLQGPQPEAHYELYDDAIHFTLAEARIDGKILKTDTVAGLLGARFFVMLSTADSPLLDKMRRLYREDFRQFARSSGFLLYELGSHLLESHRRVFQYYSAEAERIQLRLFGQVTDAIFAEVADLTGDILAFHRAVLAARDLFNELATRKSAFVAETTQPALDILADRLERLGGDIAGVRSVLNETLNLYMGMVSHRTNRLVSRLTVFSMIFLPLSFLAGVYGMNFDVLPELHWRYAYPLFWLFVLLFVAGFVVFARRKKWI